MNQKKEYVFDESLIACITDDDFEFINFSKREEVETFPMYHYYFIYKNFVGKMEVYLFKNHEPFRMLVGYSLANDTPDTNLFSIHRIFAKKCLQLQKKLQKETSYHVALNTKPNYYSKNIFISLLAYHFDIYNRRKDEKNHQNMLHQFDVVKEWVQEQHFETITIEDVKKHFSFPDNRIFDCLIHCELQGLLSSKRDEQGEKIWFKHVM